MFKQSKISRVAKREFKRILERKTLYFLIIILPMFIFLLIGSIYKNEIMRELPAAVIDYDHTQLSRTAVQMFESSGSIAIKEHLVSLDEIKKEFRRGKIQCAIIIPNNFEKDVKSGKQTSITVYKNSSNVIVGSLLLKEASTIIKTISAGVQLKKIQSSGHTKDEAMNIMMPIKLDTHSLYNPNYSYVNYFVPGLVTFILQMMIMIASVLIISSEFAHETFGEVVELSGGSEMSILFGKAIPHILINSASAFLIVGIIFPLFGVIVNGSYLLILSLFILFIIVCVMFGIMISSLFKDQFMATEVAVFINTPGFIFSGFTFPLWGMPVIHNIFGNMMPYTHFLSAYIKLSQMNTRLFAVKYDLIILTSFLIVSVVVSLFMIRMRVKKYEK
ncbi:MAG: ABC transporter permease [Melioribacteraceae bacterium]